MCWFTKVVKWNGLVNHREIFAGSNPVTSTINARVMQLVDMSALEAES